MSLTRARPGSRRRMLGRTLSRGWMVKFFLLLNLAPMAWSANNWQLDGAHGELHLFGAMTESACRLDVGSSYQEVDLGQTSSNQLLRTGDQGTSVAVRLKLFDCLRTPSLSRDGDTGNLLWDVTQPAVSVSFMARADDDDPRLIKVFGVSGLALRMRDAQGRDVRLGRRGAPILLASGQNELIYHVTPQRTAAALQAGAYRTQVEFRLVYD